MCFVASTVNKILNLEDKGSILPRYDFCEMPDTPRSNLACLVRFGSKEWGERRRYDTVQLLPPGQLLFRVVRTRVWAPVNTAKHSIPLKMS